MKVNIVDKNFGHAFTSSWYNKCKYFEWFRGNEIVSDSCFFTDLCLQDVNKVSKAKRKIAWLLEPRSINPSMYDWIEKNNKLFDYVLTYDTEFVNKGENYLYYPHGMCWIDNFNEDKYKNCSIFASEKNWADGHKLRHTIYDTFKDKYKLDGFGNYCNNRIDKKEEGLNNYYFSITVENAILPGYFTEKLIDCFATKTVPIYYGDSTSVCKFFNSNGVMFFKDMNELDKILDKLSPQLYKSKQSAIDENFSLVDTFRVPENWIYENYKFLF